MIYYEKVVAAIEHLALASHTLYVQKTRIKNCPHSFTCSFFLFTFKS